MEDNKIDPGHRGPQSIFRILGPLVLGIGILFMVVGLVDFFKAFAGFGRPRLFWCLFVGMPLMFFGSVMTKFGYMGRIARYMSQEISPVAKDTINYMADGTKDSIKTVASSIGQGLAEGGLNFGSDGGTKVRCHKCNELVDEDSKFCDQCGVTLTKSKDCPQCSEINDPDAKFCDNCGHRY